MFSGISLYKKTKSRFSGCSVTFPFELPVGWLIGLVFLKLYRLVTVKKDFDVDEKMVLRFFLTSKKWLLISLDTQKG